MPVIKPSFWWFSTVDVERFENERGVVCTRRYIIIIHSFFGWTLSLHLGHLKFHRLTSRTNFSRVKQSVEILDSFVNTCNSFKWLDKTLDCTQKWIWYSRQSESLWFRSLLWGTFWARDFLISVHRLVTCKTIICQIAYVNNFKFFIGINSCEKLCYNNCASFTWL